MCVASHEDLITERLALHAAERPDEMVLRDNSGDTTWSELWHVVTHVAGDIRTRGVRPGDRVSLSLEPSAAYLALVLGVMAAGSVPVPVNTRLTTTEALAFLRPLEPVLHVADVVHAVWSRELAPVSVVAAHLGDEGELRHRLRDLCASKPTHGEYQPDAAAIIFPTGGTTGLPKGAWYSHRRLAAFCRSVATAQVRQRDDLEVYFSPFFHVSLCTGLLSTLYAGGAAHILTRFDPAVTLQALSRGGNRLMGPPTMFVALRADPHFGDTDRTGVRQVAFGATDATKPFVDSLLSDFPCSQLFYGYGATEYGPVTLMPHEVMVAGARPGVGRAVPGADVRVVDAGGAALPAGEVGELAVSCDWQANGYWGHPQATAETFTDAGVRLGDLGAMDEDGWIRIIGRSKEMIITGGENVFPIEVETVLAEHPDVSEVCVYGVPDEYWGERVEAAVVPRPGATIVADELVEFARRTLAGYKIPRQTRMLTTLPLTSNNKPDRRALRARAEKEL